VTWLRSVSARLRIIRPERIGPTARTGGQAVGKSRSRCSFFNMLGPAFNPKNGLNYLASIGA